MIFIYTKNMIGPMIYEKTFLTEWTENNKLYGDEIKAINWIEAQKIADFNNRGEKVIGILEQSEEIKENEFSPWLNVHTLRTN